MEQDIEKDYDNLRDGTMIIDQSRRMPAQIKREVEVQV